MVHQFQVVLQNRVHSPHLPLETFRIIFAIFLESTGSLEANNNASTIQASFIIGPKISKNFQVY